MQRTDRFISENTEYTRSQAKELLKKGKITVNGEKIKDGKFQINPETDVVAINGEKISVKGSIVLAMNKPKGYVCATEDKNEKTVMELLPDEYKNQGLFPAGRLDKDTTGLVILTNDGDLAHKIISPKKHTSKHYLVTLARKYETEYEEKFKNGIVLSDGTKCKEAEVYLFNEEKNQCIVKLTEGKYHQVRRMFAACGNHVENLHRFAIGNYVLSDKIALGECVVLLHKEICDLLTISERTFFNNEF